MAFSGSSSREIGETSQAPSADTVDPSTQQVESTEKEDEAPSADSVDPSTQEVESEKEEEVRGIKLSIYDAVKRNQTDGRDGYLLGNDEDLNDLTTVLTATRNTVLHIHIACASRGREALPNNLATVINILDKCPALLWQKNKRSETALHLAARHGHNNIVEHLVATDRARRNPEEGHLLIRIPTEDKDTALHEAVRFNHLDVVRTLTTEDPNFPYPANHAGETPLYMAVERGHGAIVDILLETCGRNPPFQGPNGRTALHAAVRYNDTETTGKLLARYTNESALTKVVDERGWTPLHLAASLGHTSVVKQLLESDRSAAFVRDIPDKKTAVHIAASKGHLDVIKELILQCPDCCELVDQRNQNLLHHAASHNQFHILTFVRGDPWLSNILLNGKDDGHNTPLHHLFKKESSLHSLLSAVFFPKSCRDFIRDARVDKMGYNMENLNPYDVFLGAAPITRGLYGKVSKFTGVRRAYRIKRIEDSGGEGEISSELRNANLVAATLIATVSFAAFITMPGGYLASGPHQGQAVLSKKINFRIFISANMSAFFFSCFAVCLQCFLGKSRPSFSRVILFYTALALLSMAVAFVFAAAAVL